MCANETQRKSHGGIGDFVSQNIKKTSNGWRQGSAKDFALDQDGIKWIEVGWTSRFGLTFWCSLDYSKCWSIGGIFAYLGANWR